MNSDTTTRTAWNIDLRDIEPAAFAALGND